MKNIKYLIGKTGTMYLIETATNIQETIQGLIEMFSELPSSLESVMTSNFPPLGVSFTEIHQWFETQEYEIINYGKTSLHTNLTLPDGTKIELPAIYALIKRPKSDLTSR